MKKQNAVLSSLFLMLLAGLLLSPGSKVFAGINVAVKNDGPTRPYAELAPIRLKRLTEEQIQIIAQKSTELKPGEGGFKRQRHSLNKCIGSVDILRNNNELKRPIFVVSSDQQSLRWIRTNRSKLEHLGALGLVVNQTQPLGLNEVAQALPNSHLFLADSKSTKKFFGAKCYPVLITKNYIKN